MITPPPLWLLPSSFFSPPSSFSFFYCLVYSGVIQSLVFQAVYVKNGLFRSCFPHEGIWRRRNARWVVFS